jgi:hypothetical protein
VVKGSFNLPEIEAGDYDAVADVEDGGVFFGSVSEVGYTLRIELNESGREAINKSGTTQFRLYFPNSDVGADWIGFDNGVIQGREPRLDVYFEEPSASIVDMFDPNVKVGNIPVVTMLVFVGFCGLALGGIGLISLIIVRWQQREEDAGE